MTAAPSHPSQLAPEVIAEAKRLRASILSLARSDPATFAEFVLRHEKTGNRITLAPMHDEWHALMSAYRRLIVWSHVEGGKTSQAIARLLFEIGMHPNGRYAVLGISSSAAKKIVSTVQRYIDHSAEFRAVFPRIRAGTPWTTTAFTVQRNVFSKDPTLQAVGARGHPIGARLDGVLVDDILDHLNTRTKEQRSDLEKWFISEIVGRLTEGAWIWIIGNAYYSDDLLNTLATKYGYRWKRYPVADENGNPAFPQEWSAERIRAKEEELGGKDSSEAKRQLYCVSRSEESSRVKAEWLDNALALGEGLELPERIMPEDLARLSKGDVSATTHTGLDIGVGKQRKHAKSVLWTILRFPSGTMRLVGLKAGRWSAREIVTNLLTEQARFSSTVAVESNGAQTFLLQNAWEEDRGSELYVLPHHTGSNKHHPVLGVESVFIDLARGHLELPSVRVPRTPDDPEDVGPTKLVGATPEIKEFVQDALDYDPSAHTSDIIMAAWFARENARLMHLGSGTPTVQVRVLGQPEAPPTPPANDDAPEDEDELTAWAPVLRRPKR